MSARLSLLLAESVPARVVAEVAAAETRCIGRAGPQLAGLPGGVEYGVLQIGQLLCLHMSLLSLLTDVQLTPVTAGMKHTAVVTRNSSWSVP